MGKHRNGKQEHLFLEFMTANPSLARGFCKGDKVNQEEKWKELANILNDAGPPVKEVAGWKKAWIDWKITIRKKLYRKKAEELSSDGGSEDKYGLSKIESSIIFICDLDNQAERPDDSEEFITETSSLFQSPVSSPKFVHQSTKKRKHDSLRDSFLEALTQNSKDNFACDMEIKVEKEDETEGINYETSNYSQSPISSPNLTTPPNKKKKNEVHMNSILETMAQNSRALRAEKTNRIETKLCSIDRKLDELGKKYDILIELKKEQIEEMKKDREERRRHNLEIEKHNSIIKTLKSERDITQF